MQDAEPVCEETCFMSELYLPHVQVQRVAQYNMSVPLLDENAHGSQEKLFSTLHPITQLSVHDDGENAAFEWRQKELMPLVKPQQTLR